MASLVWLESATEDTENIFDFLAQSSPAMATTKLKTIHDAVDILKHAPKLGHPATLGRRELLIGKHHGGYVAVYRYDPITDTVFVLEIRSQRQLPSS
ncbi:type II toxin-antitoxin system RelE/ParE family toxin [Pseudoduganella violacea]|uniref:Plasmid stabilization system protein ParE n=1 Tax=Pseudoduganella violacea TaxID=1715466 RepID=A0A7W5B6X1_9BURK|nr:type II toxin-antitoxin system RelE/ParE family toxin [Pseudoduganella violacea]MBB3117662.1 plasmid stabilization system protein ParE [Pseudoduganella violacea]